VRHTFTVERALPWPQFNEYEGEVHGVLDGHRVSAHVLLIGESWADLTPGLVREVSATFRRYRDLAKVDPGTPLKLTGAVIVGTVRELDGERLTVDSVIGIDVDLDLDVTSERALPAVRVGDRIRVEGEIEIDFDPDDYEDD
jgi:hypothetical protein